MTVTLNLPPDLEAAFLAEAQTYGLPPEDYPVEHIRSKRRPRPSARNPLSNCSPIRGLDLDFSRNPSVGRPVDL